MMAAVGVVDDAPAAASWKQQRLLRVRMMRMPVIDYWEQSDDGMVRLMMMTMKRWIDEGLLGREHRCHWMLMISRGQV